MSARLQALRDELWALAGRYAEGAAGPFKPHCLALIDRVARCATDIHREIPADVLAHLTRALHATGGEDVAGVIEEVGAALTILANPQRSRHPGRQQPPPPAMRREGACPAEPRPPGERAKNPTPVGELVDPLLARLRAKAPKR